MAVSTALETMISVTDGFSAGFLAFEKRVQHATKPVENLKSVLKSFDRISGLKSFRLAFADLSKHSTAFLFNVRNIGQSFGYIGSAFKGVVSTLDKVSSRGDELAKTSERLGFTVVELQQFRYVADLAGVSSENFTKGIRKLSEASVEAAGGSKVQKEAFKALGISVKNSEGEIKSSQDLLLELSRRFVETGPKALSASEKIFAAQKLLGKSGTELITVLNQGPDAIKAQMDELIKLGYMTEKQAKASAEYRDALDKMNVAVDNLTTSLAGDILGPMTSSVEYLTEFLSQNKSVFKEALDPFVKQIPEMAKTFAAALPDVLKVFDKVMWAVNSFVDSVGLFWPTLIIVGSGIIAPLTLSLAALGKAAVSLFKPFVSLFTLIAKIKAPTEKSAVAVNKMSGAADKAGAVVDKMSKKASKSLRRLKKDAKNTETRLNQLTVTTKKTANGFNLMGNSAVKAGTKLSSSGSKAMGVIGKMVGGLMALDAAGSFFERITDETERKKGVGRIFVDTLEDLPVLGSFLKGIENLSVGKVDFGESSVPDLTAGMRDLDESELFRSSTKTINNNTHSTIDVNFNGFPKNTTITRRGTVDPSLLGYSMNPAF